MSDQKDSKTKLKTGQNVVLDTELKTVIQSDSKTISQTELKTIAQSDLKNVSQTELKTITQTTPKTKQEEEFQSVSTAEQNTDRIKLLLIIPTLVESGAEKQLTLLASYLPKDRFDVHVCILTANGPLSKVLDENNVPYTLIGKCSKLSFGAYFKLKKLIRKLRPDIVHTWIFAANAYGRLAAIRAHVPVVICGERCVDPWKTRLHFMIDRYLAKKTDCIAVNSEGIKDFYVSNNLPKEKFAVIPNAAQPLPPSCLSKKEIFEGFDLPYPEDAESEPPGRKRPALIGMIARLWPQKRVQEAIWSCSQLDFAGLDFHLLIFGDGPEKESLLRYRARLEMERRVHFLGHRSDVSDFLPHLDLLWCTSAYEGQSNSIIEAMSAGVPVLASDIPGNRELVVNGQTGLLIPEFGEDISRRRTAFTHETLELFKPKNNQRRLEMGRAAAEQIQKEFTLEKMIERYSMLYQSLYLQKNHLKIKY